MHGGVRISYMHFSFVWSANLGHASWHLKETVARTGVYRVNAVDPQFFPSTLAFILWVSHSPIVLI